MNARSRDNKIISFVAEHITDIHATFIADVHWQFFDKQVLDCVVISFCFVIRLLWGFLGGEDDKNIFESLCITFCIRIRAQNGSILA